MEIRYQCGAKDYVEAQRACLRRTFTYYFMPGMGVLCLSGGILLLLGKTGASPLPLLLLGVWWLGWPLLYWPWKVNRDFRKNPNFSREWSATIDEEGIQSRSEVAQSTRKWSGYVKFRQTSNLFLLYHGSRLFEVVPKRAFTGPQLEQFQRLLQLKVPAK